MEAAPARGLKKTGLLPILFWMKGMSMLTKSKPKDPTHMSASNKSVSMNLVRTAILCFALPLAIAMPQGCANFAARDKAVLEQHITLAVFQLNTAGIEADTRDFDVEVWDGPIPFNTPYGLAWCMSKGKPGARQTLVASPDTPQRALTEEIILLTAKHWGVNRQTAAEKPRVASTGLNVPLKNVRIGSAN